MYAQKMVHTTIAMFPASAYNPLGTDVTKWVLVTMGEKGCVLCTSKSVGNDHAAVVEELESDEIDLSQLASEEAVAMLRQQCPDVEVTNEVAGKLVAACSFHLLALTSIGAQLRLKCKKGCMPEDILESIESHRTRRTNQLIGQLLNLSSSFTFNIRHIQ